MAREFHGGACYFLIYEFFMQRAMLKEKKLRNELADWKKCLYGAAAGLSYTHNQKICYFLCISNVNFNFF
jgi:hypothetical protein